MQQKFITRRDAIKTLGGISLASILGNYNSCGKQQKPNKPVRQVICGKYTIAVTKRVDVSLNPERNFHSVSACRAPNGDFLVSHQDAL